MSRHNYVFLIVVSVSSLIWFPWLYAANGEDAPPEATIACSVLESHVSQELGVSAAVFHQRNKEEAARFSALLKEHPDASVEFQTTDGAWHKASVARLKSSFGRGLLLFASRSAELKEKDTFVLKFE